MALQNSLSSRLDNLNVAINNAMCRNKMKPEDIAKNKIMSANTFYKKMQHPNRFKFDDYYRLDDLLHFNDYEKSLIYGLSKN